MSMTISSNDIESGVKAWIRAKCEKNGDAFEHFVSDEFFFNILFLLSLAFCVWGFIWDVETTVPLLTVIGILCVLCLCEVSESLSLKFWFLGIARCLAP